MDRTKPQAEGDLAATRAELPRSPSHVVYDLVKAAYTPGRYFRMYVVDSIASAAPPGAVPDS